MRIKGTRSFTVVVAVTGFAAAASAEPVEVRQGDQIGAGYTFRRGTTCTVVTVRHAVPYEGVEVKVIDRTGGAATGQRIYDNETYDLALVALPENASVACTSGWPETAWIRTAKFNSKSTFEIVRHTPDDRETILPVSYGGGTSNAVTLVPTGKLKARVTFSGSVVRAGDSLLALVQMVDPDTDRIEALRFDVIDRLVGSRFKSAGSSGSPVSFAGVFQRDRVNTNWTTYVNAWLREQSGHPVMPGQDPKARCDIRVNVIDWSKGNVANPEYDALQQQYNSCGTVGSIGGILVVKRGPEAKRACQQQVRAKMAEVGRYLNGHHLTMEVVMTPQRGAIASALETVDVVVPRAAATSRTEEEMVVMQKAAGSVLTKLFETGACE